MKARTEFININDEFYLRVFLILCPNDKYLPQEILVMEKKITDLIQERNK